jgi:hypothetical protein
VAAPLYPRHPERVCWGCNKFCPAAELACGNGTIRTPHPIELLGEDWLEPADQDRERTHSDATSSAIPA